MAMQKKQKQVLRCAQDDNFKKTNAGPSLSGRLRVMMTISKKMPR
jgi:hypothetical protein